MSRLGAGLTAAAVALIVCGLAAASRDLREASAGPLQKRIATEARRDARFLDDPSVNIVTVYGPRSRAALVRASSGDWVRESAHERKERFYLLVLHGHFVCHSCSAPPGGKLPRGRLATLVWSPSEGITDLGLANRLRPSIARLGTPSVMRLAK